ASASDLNLALCMRLETSEQRFGILQFLTAKTLGEPRVNRLQQAIGLTVSFLLLPMLGERGGRAELPPAGCLLPRDRQGPTQFGSGTFVAPEPQQHFAARTMQFRGKNPLLGRLRGLHGLSQQIEGDPGLAEAGVGRGKLAKIQGVTVSSRVASIGGNGAAHKR